jgi:hypothetical protein
MLIKLGNSVNINITAIDEISVIHVEEKRITKKGGLFTPEESVLDKTPALKVHYRDMEGEKRTYTLRWTKEIWGDHAINEVFKARDELLGQIKELELAQMTATLENSIRKNGDG